MSVPAIPSALAAIRALAGVTLRRLFRSRAVWVAGVLAVLPILYASAVRGRHVLVHEEIFVFVELVLAVLVPMLVASSIGEEIEERTLTYLWSRPVPRWTMLAGKLCALAPVALVFALVSWGAAMSTATDTMPAGRTVLALAAGTLAMSAVATGWAMLSPRHGMALSIVYMLADTFLGALPASLAKLSITYQTRAVSGLYSSYAALGGGLVALAALSAVWIVIAAWRIRRLEA